jgi:hypothetical protein
MIPADSIRICSLVVVITTGNGKGGWINELVILLIVHYSVYLGSVIFADPGKEVSVGMHEVTGPCDETVLIPTAFGMVSFH